LTALGEHPRVGTRRRRVDRSFIVRVSRDDAGQLSGTVERVKTGEKHRFQDPETVGRLIARMVAAEEEVTKESR
jgi:hypothetical protein